MAILKGKTKIALLSLEISNNYLLRVDSTDGDVKKEADRLRDAVESAKKVLSSIDDSGNKVDSDIEALIE